MIHDDELRQMANGLQSYGAEVARELLATRAVVRAAQGARDLIDATWLTFATGDYDEPEIEALVHALAAYEEATK